MNIFAHRGLLEEYPENTFTALTEAAKAGFGLETDLRLTKDGEFVVIHDDNFKRLTGVDMKVADSTLAEAERQVYLGSEERIISFRRLLQWMNEHPAKIENAIHLKADSQTEEGLRLVAKYWNEFGMYDRFFVFDLTRAAAERLKAIDPKIRIALIVSEHKFEPTIHMWDEVKDFGAMDIVWAAEYRTLYSADFIQAVHATGRPCYAMSPDVHGVLGHPLAKEGYEKTWQELAAWGADGICTDEAKKFAKMFPA